VQARHVMPRAQSHARSHTALAFLAIALAGSLPACSEDQGASSAGAGGAAGDPLPELPSPALPTAPLSYAADLPPSFQTPQVQTYDTTPEDNDTSDAGAALGRVLFYDKRLSRNGAVSCASCHQQAHGFSDSRVLSVGFEGGETARHAMPAIDARFYQRGKFFWDERAVSLEEQVLGPIQNEVEMGMTLDELEDRLAETSYYPPLFEAAFGDPAVTSDRVARALSQFLRAIVSYRSRWDDAVAKTSSIAGDLPGLSAQENRGKQIFFGQHDPATRGLCGTCHLMGNELAFAPPGPHPPFTNTAVFYMIRPANNGLLDDGDEGVGAITDLAMDDGKFKSPSLRNVALRPPYMHDGRFATLEEVVEHYDSGVAAHPNLDPALRQAGPGSGPMQLHLSADDKAALVAFLGTLTDETLAKDVRFSDPFPPP
jgi:cytochrome c peroxidase